MKHYFSENMKTTNSLILRKEFEENANKQTYIKYRLHAPAITASCDRLKKCCWTQTRESCFSANYIIHSSLSQN